MLQSSGSIDYIDSAPRIDDFQHSSQKRRKRTEYLLDAGFCLASRLEIQILKRLKMGFYALQSHTESEKMMEEQERYQ